MNILAICGSRVKDGNMEALLNHALQKGNLGDEVQCHLVSLADEKIGPCTHCNWCLRKQIREKPCVQEDDMSELYGQLMEADGIILASPAHFGRLSGALADFIDRTRAFMHGKAYQYPLANRVGGAMSIAYFRGGGVETTLASINHFFLIHRMILAVSGLYQQGAAALSSLEGTGRFDPEPRHLVLQDQYGLKSARQLVERMCELIRLIKAGQKALEQPSTA